ncbi:HET-domain-containing protein, partial [Glonium stellatum]
MSDFQYQALSRDGSEPAIRVLELLPGEPQEGLRCKLQNVQLSPTLKYEALSYCWGKACLTHTVSCNGFKMSITPSLHSALSRLRNKDRIRILWADAICINQDDDQEKAYQVSLMATIYSHATQVNIWLGEHDAGSDTLGDFITQVYDASMEYRKATNAHSLPELSATELGRLGIPGHYDLRYLALSALVNRPWFDRVWIIQEVAKSSAAIVFCGDWAVPWPHLIEAANWIYEMGIGHAIRRFADEGTPKQNQRYLQWTESKVRSETPQSLLTLLIRHRQCLSSNPRDKIFALCGLADDADIVNVDYGKSKEEVYMDTAIALIYRHHTLEVVSAAGLPSYASVPTDSSLPSWIPDWT